MVQTTRLFFVLLVSLSVAQWGFVIAGDTDGLSSRIDEDLFLEDEGSGMGWKGSDDEISGSGNGFDDEDATQKPFPPRTTPSSPIGRGGGVDPVPGGKDDDISDDITLGGGGEGTNNIFEQKESSTASFFSQPGILAAIICGAVVGLLCAILLVMFVVYRMRKKDEGSYVLDDSKRTTASYGKSKEFFA